MCAACGCCCVGRETCLRSLYLVECWTWWVCASRERRPIVAPVQRTVQHLARLCEKVDGRGDLLPFRLFSACLVARVTFLFSDFIWWLFDVITRRADSSLFPWNLFSLNYQHLIYWRIKQWGPCCYIVVLLCRVVLAQPWSQISSNFPLEWRGRRESRVVASV